MAEEQAPGLIDLDRQIARAAVLPTQNVPEPLVRFLDVGLGCIGAKPEDIQRFLLRHRA